MSTCRDRFFFTRGIVVRLCRISPRISQWMISVLLGDKIKCRVFLKPDLVFISSNILDCFMTEAEHLRTHKKQPNSCSVLLFVSQPQIFFGRYFKIHNFFFLSSRILRKQSRFLTNQSQSTMDIPRASWGNAIKTLGPGTTMCLWGWMVSKFDSRYPILQQHKSKDDFESLKLIDGAALVEEGGFQFWGGRVRFSYSWFEIVDKRSGDRVLTNLWLKFQFQNAHVLTVEFRFSRHPRTHGAVRE